MTERISLEDLYCSLSTQSSEKTLSSTCISSISGTSKHEEHQSGSKRFIKVEDHPLFKNLNRSQVEAYYEFVNIAKDRYQDIEKSTDIISVCLDNIILLRF